MIFFLSLLPKKAMKVSFNSMMRSSFFIMTLLAICMIPSASASSPECTINQIMGRKIYTKIFNNICLELDIKAGGNLSLIQVDFRNPVCDAEAASAAVFKLPISKMEASGARTETEAKFDGSTFGVFGWSGTINFNKNGIDSQNHSKLVSLDTPRRTFGLEITIPSCGATRFLR